MWIILHFLNYLYQKSALFLNKKYGNTADEN